jgi:hypothetical protein
MDDPAGPLGKYPDDEFWKMDSAIRNMLILMNKRSDLLRQIREEKSIPDQARDMAVKSVSNELIENKMFFFDYLLNFIGIGMQGLHRIDILFKFSILEGGIIEMDCCTLLVNDDPVEIPVEIGKEYVNTIFSTANQRNPETVIQCYREEETHYDTLLGGVSGRCCLLIMEELFPGHCIHVTMKLPAQTLIEYEITL